MRRARRSIGGGHSRAMADDERAVGADAAVAELHMLLSGEPLDQCLHGPLYVRSAWSDDGRPA
jgi:hypothetical protein